jgi:prophage DNA circulation protein
MRPTDAKEAVDLLNNYVLKPMLALVRGQSGLPGAQLKNLCGSLAANAYALLNATPADRTFWIDLAKCFDAARAVSTVTFETIDAVRTSALSALPTGAPAIAVRNFSVRMVLVEQARILAATNFTSRQDVDRYFNAMHVSFEQAETVAANNLDNVAYRALVKLHAAVTNDLANRSRPLPKMVTYTTATSKPALYLAQFLYQDPSRYQELIDENKPIRPLFMPRVGQALSE